MNSPLLYPWCEQVDKAFPHLGRWQKLGLAFLSYGLVLSQSCRLSRVAQHLSGRVQASAMERRLQRWLANEHLTMSVLFPCWVAWVLRC